MSLSSGTRLGPYEIVSPLGAGGMGEVYRAKDTRLGREVAVKVLPERYSGDADLARRFEQEARAVAALSHSNIVTLYDFGRDEDRLYAVSELLEGETLRTRLAHTPPAWQKAVDIAVAVADGLAAAHARGIVHRDLKPENIFLTSDGRVKILDFGLARWKPEKGSADETSAPTAVGGTEPGYVMGTVGYMAPEQIRGEAAEATSDIFSLGCVLTEAISGRKAFSRNTSAETMASILRDPAPDLAAIDPALPRDLCRTIAHCLEKAPGERFQSARDLAFALRAVQSAAASPRVSSGSTKRTIDSIAVLPLASAAGDDDAEFLADGITEALIMRLSRLSGLRVIARTSAFRYKGPGVDPLAAGRALGVGAVVTGRVIHRGNTIVVRVELVDLADESQLWGEQYRREADDVLAVENEIATQISENLRLKLTGEEKARLTRMHTESPEANRLYLRGRYFWGKRNEEAIRKGIDYFRQAIEIDPEYALAYVGIADGYGVLGFHSIAAPGEAFPRAKAAARKALELDPSLAEARAPLAYALDYYDWNWSEAESEYGKCLQAIPNYPTVHNYYASMLTQLGRFEESIREWKRAQDLDPLSLVIRAATGWCYYYARRYDDAILEAKKALEMDPTFVIARRVLGLVYAQTSRPDESIEEFRKAVEFSGGATAYRAELAQSLAIAGREADARRALDELQRDALTRYVSPYYVGTARLALGERDRAFEDLQQAFEERAHGLSFMRIDPNLDAVRSDTRYGDLVRRIGFPAEGPD
ncbi:MAG TPA: protein kinase [Thermoanaerobaculia bacterium]|nr:protein kinase [Thermoanaerobaculia bacterium]